MLARKLSSHAETKGPSMVKSAHRVIQILEAVAFSRVGLRHAEMAQTLRSQREAFPGFWRIWSPRDTSP
jgi:hypothetical protein